MNGPRMMPRKGPRPIRDSYMPGRHENPSMPPRYSEQFGAMRDVYAAPAQAPADAARQQPPSAPAGPAATPPEEKKAGWGTRLKNALPALFIGVEGMEAMRKASFDREKARMKQEQEQKEIQEQYWGKLRDDAMKALDPRLLDPSDPMYKQYFQAITGDREEADTKRQEAMLRSGLIPPDMDPEQRKYWQEELGEKKARAGGTEGGYIEGVTPGLADDFLRYEENPYKKDSPAYAPAQRIIDRRKAEQGKKETAADRRAWADSLKFGQQLAQKRGEYEFDTPEDMQAWALKKAYEHYSLVQEGPVDPKKKAYEAMWYKVVAEEEFKDALDAVVMAEVARRLKAGKKTDGDGSVYLEK